MGTFVVAYVVVWLAVALYVVRLGAAQRRIQRAIESLQAQWDRDEAENAEDSPSKAA